MKLFFTTIISIISITALAQAPQKVSYQAIARQASGVVISNAPIGVKFIIYQGSIGGTISYEETHNPTTNQFGLFTLFIGGGSPSIGAFNTINWAIGPYFIETLIDPAGGTSYSSIGTQQFMSVPYALFAEKAGNASPTPTITGNGLAIVTPTTGSLFSVSVPTPALNYTPGTNVLSLTQGTSVTTTTLSGSGSNTITITGLGATTVTPNGAGSIFTINTPSYTAGSGISISSGIITNTATSITPTININSPNSITNPLSGVYNISVPSYTAGSGISISSGIITNTATSITPTININSPNTITNPLSGVYNISVPSYTAGSGISISSGIITNTATSITPTININSPNTITNPLSGVYNISVPSYTAGSGISLSSGIITNTATSITPTLIAGTNMIVNPTIASNSYTVSSPNYSLSTPSNTLLLLSNGINNSTVIIPTQLLSLSGSTLTSGISTNSINLSALPGLWTASGGSLYPTSASRIGIGTTTPNNSIQVAGLINFENNGSNTGLGYNTGSGIGPNNIYNTFLGYFAGQAVGTGTASGNTFVGYNSGINSLNGNNNSFLGMNSGINNTTGYYNTFLGVGADLFSSTQRTNATAIGYNAKVDTNNAIVLGSSGVNVGIGTNKPTSSLHITNNIGSQIKFGHINQPNLEWYFDVSAISHMGLRNENNGTALNVMDFNTGTGYVGIGVTNPGYKLSVIGASGDDNASIYASNSSSNTTVASHGVSGLAQSTHSLSSGIYGNSIYGPSIYGYKTSLQTGIAGRFEIANTTNSADAVFALTVGTGAAVHAASGTTVSSSPALALLVEEGHIKSKQATAPTTSTISVSGGGISGVSVSLTNGTDVKGTLNAVLTTTTLINANNNAAIKVTFNKPYSIIPTVVVTPLTDMLGMSYYLSNVSTTSFQLNIKNTTGLNLSTTASMPINFNYIVIE